MEAFRENSIENSIEVLPEKEKTHVKQVYRLDWEESEKGWGERPDGYSLHLTNEDVKEFVKEYWNTMPDEVPEEYSRPFGSPYVINVDNTTYETIKTSRNGIRRYS